MKPIPKKSAHVYDIWPPAEKRADVSEKRKKKRLPRNVNFIGLDEALLGEVAPVYDTETKAEPPIDQKDEEKEEKEEEYKQYK